MRKDIIIISTFFLIVFCSWVNLRPNKNTWNIRIGQTKILTSESNRMGDTANLRKDQVNLTDTLYAEQYLCGNFPETNSVTKLTIKDRHQRIIAESTNKENELLGYKANIPLKNIYDKLTNKEVLDIFMTIQNPNQVEYSTLMARLKLN